MVTVFLGMPSWLDNAGSGMVRRTCLISWNRPEGVYPKTGCLILKIVFCLFKMVFASGHHAGIADAGWSMTYRLKNGDALQKADGCEACPMPPRVNRRETSRGRRRTAA